MSILPDDDVTSDGPAISGYRVVQNGAAAASSRVVSRVVGLFAPFDEPISQDFYRQVSRARSYAILLLVLLNLAGTLALLLTSGCSTYYLVRQIIIMSLGLCDVALGFFMARAGLEISALRRWTLVCAAIEVAILMVSMHGLGSVNSYMMSASVLLVVLYRLGMDRSLSAWVLVLVLIGHWGIVLAEVMGLMEVQPVALGNVDFVYRNPAAQVSAMGMITGIYVLSYMMAHWMVLRLRHRDVAVRILREALRRGRPERVGEWTGAVLGGRYEMGELIGEGGAGSVYAAQHRRSRRKVAVKVLHHHLVNRTRALRRFRREAEITGQLNDEHVVQILDVDEHEGYPYLVFELLSGIDLRARVRREGPLSSEEVLLVARGVSSGLDAAHRAGVVHRDLNPANVFLCRGEGVTKVKVLDFGVAKTVEEETALTAADVVIGTPAFVSPEQISGKFGEVGPRTDVYALGATLYFAVTGTLPFPTTEPGAAYAAVCNYCPRSPSSLVATLPSMVDDVLLTALAKYPRDRFASAMELARALAHAFEGKISSELHEHAQRIRGQNPVWRPPQSPSTVSPGGAEGRAATATLTA